MPYTVKKVGDKYVVYKRDTGKRVGATAGNKEALRKYMAALHINAKENITKNSLEERVRAFIRSIILKEIKHSRKFN